MSCDAEGEVERLADEGEGGAGPLRPSSEKTTASGWADSAADGSGDEIAMPRAGLQLTSSGVGR